jgi:hypothetical protein
MSGSSFTNDVSGLSILREARAIASSAVSFFIEFVGFAAKDLFRHFVSGAGDRLVAAAFAFDGACKIFADSCAVSSAAYWLGVAQQV